MKFCIIVPLARCVVKFACVAAGFYGFMALGALNVPALICAVLALNALLGLRFALDNKKAAQSAGTLKSGKVKRNDSPFHLHFNRKWRFSSNEI